MKRHPDLLKKNIEQILKKKRKSLEKNSFVYLKKKIQKINTNLTLPECQIDLENINWFQTLKLMCDYYQQVEKINKPVERLIQSISF